jgi:hypothetical protein
MAIGNAVERDHFVYVYDEKGYHLSTLFAGNGPDDGLGSAKSGSRRPSLRLRSMTPTAVGC